MRESTTYQYILEEGRKDQARKTLLRLGRLRFGPLEPELEAKVQTIEDLELLERMCLRLLDAANWREVLETF